MELLGLFILLLSFRWAMGSYESRAEHEPLAAQPPSEADLSSRLQNAAASQSAILSQALQHIESLRSSSSCSRIAAMTLLQSCQSLNPSPSEQQELSHDAEFGLDRVKVIYATRLAACELAEAKLNIPSQCSDFMPRRSPCGYGRRWSNLWSKDEVPDGPANSWCYPEAGHVQITSCLKALEARPQYWTSYSNAKQNAVIICQASRTAIDKDRDLNAYKSLVGVTTNVTAEVKQAQEKVSEIIVALDLLQSEAAQNLENALNSSRGLFSLMRDEIQAATSRFLTSLSKASLSAQAEFEHLKSHTRDTRSDVESIRSSLHKFQSDMSHGMTELAVSQRKELEHGQVVAAGFLQSIATSYEVVAQLMLAANSSLESLEMISEKQDRIQRNQEAIEASQSAMMDRFQALARDITNASQALESITRIFSAISNFKPVAAFFITLVQVLQVLGISLLAATGRVRVPTALTGVLILVVIWTGSMLLLFHSGTWKTPVIDDFPPDRPWIFMPLAFFIFMAITYSAYMLFSFCIQKIRSRFITEVDGGHFLKIELRD